MPWSAAISQGSCSFESMVTCHAMLWFRAAAALRAYLPCHAVVECQLPNGQPPLGSLPGLHQGHVPCTLSPLSGSSGRGLCLHDLLCFLQHQQHSCPGYMQQPRPFHTLKLRCTQPKRSQAV